MVLWKIPYRVAVVHSRRPWRPALLVFDEEQMRVAAVGTPFSVPEPPEAVKWRGLDVQYPYHLEIAADECRLLIECQDRCPTEFFVSADRFSEAVRELLAENAS